MKLVIDPTRFHYFDVIIQHSTYVTVVLARISM